jgi:hypothetical protein
MPPTCGGWDRSHATPHDRPRYRRSRYRCDPPDRVIPGAPQGDLIVLFGVSKVTTSRLVARLIATEQLRTSACPDGARGRPATWLLLPGRALPSGAERQAIASLVNDAAIVLQAARPDGQFPNCTMALSTENRPAAPTASAPPNYGSTDTPRSSEMEAIQLELPGLTTPNDRPLNLALRIDAVRTSQLRSSVPPQQRLTVADASEFHEELAHPFPATPPSTDTGGDLPVESPRPAHATPALPSARPATAQQVRPARSIAQPYGRDIPRRLCVWYRSRRVGNCWTTLGHRVSTAGRRLLIYLWSIGAGFGTHSAALGVASGAL